MSREIDGEANPHPRERRVRDRLARAGSVLALVFACSSVLASSAGAVPSHPSLGTFGDAAQPVFVTPMALAVDQSNTSSGGDLLVVDAGRNEKQRVVITEGSEQLSGSFKLIFNGQTTGWTGFGTVTCNGTSTSITSVTTSTGAVAKGELIVASPGSCIKPNTTIVSCVPVSCNSPTALNLSQATESNANSGPVGLNADLNFSMASANLTEALVKLPSIGTGNVQATESGSASPVKRLVEFRNSLGASDVPLITCDGSGLSAGATCSIEDGTASAPQGAIASVQRFKSDGSPHEFSALGTHVIDGRRGPGGKPRVECESAPEPQSCDETPQNRLIFGAAQEVQIAIAPPGSVAGTEGNIYVTQSNAAGGKLVDIFQGNGKYLGQLSQAGGTPFGEPCGVTVDSTGNVFVGDFSGKIYKYTPSTNSPGNGDIVATITAVAQPCSLATGAGASAGNLFAKKFSGSEVFKVSAETGLSECLVGTGLKVITTDPDGGHLYAGKGSELLEFDASGGCMTALSPTTPVPSAVEGVAVDKTSRTGNLYVSRAGSGSILVYGALQEPPELALVQPPTGISGAGATVRAKVNPRGSTVTECKFEFGKTPAYGSAVPCAGSLPAADSSSHDLSATIEGLQANGTTYHYRLVVNTAAGVVVQTEDAVFTTAETFITGAALDVTDEAATLSGTVNLEKLGLTECVFEYGVSTAYGFTTPCSPEPSSIPNDSTDRGVTAPLTGLSGNAVYHYRLKAVNSAGTVFGQDRTFRTLGPPGLSETATVQVGPESAKLYTVVNPNGFNTNYYFEYGPTPAYGSRAPGEFDLFAGSGTSPVKGSVNLTGLVPGAVYHFRVVASNSSGTTESADQVFSTSATSCPNEAIRLQQGAMVSGLPGCMALEMVSPTLKYSQQASFPQVSADGSRVVFRSIAALAGTPNLPALGVLGGAGEAYVATRGEGGWATQPTAPPTSLANAGWGRAEFFARSFTPDLTRWFQLGSSIENGDHPQGIGQVFRGQLGGSFQPYTSRLVSTDGAGHGPANVEGAFAESVSSDSSHFYFRMGDISASYLPGDPSPTGGASDPNVYIAQLSPDGSPAPLQLLARDETGMVWGGNCGARVGGVEGNDITANTRDQGAVSADGAHVYFSTRPTQPTNSTPGGPISGSCLSANKLRIMLRLETVAGLEISEAIINECDRVAPACKSAAEADGDDVYEGASVDGSRLYFTTNRQLADSDLDGSMSGCSKTTAVAGCDLYLYDSDRPAGFRLVQISAGEGVVGEHELGKDARVYSGTVGVAGDGSRVYFTAAGVLTGDPNPEGDRPALGEPNLYVYEAGSGDLAFIGALGAGDSGQLWGGRGNLKNRAYPVPVTGRNGSGEEIGGDGHVLLFQTESSLTAGDADGGRLDIYRYDSAGVPAALDCISCLKGGPDAGPFDVGDTQQTLPGRKTGTDFAEVGRWVSEDGMTVAFRSAQELVPGSGSGTAQGFLWRDGSLFLLPSSKSNSEKDPNRDGPFLSHDGETVAFRSTARLLPSDKDTAGDIYVARMTGGFLQSSPPTACVGEACQGPPAPAPPGLAPGSSFYAGGGNVIEKPRPKKRGKKRKHGKRKGKASRIGQASGRSAQRASNEQGGQK